MRAPLAASILAAAVLAPLATLTAQQTVDGWRSTMTMTVDSGDGRPHVTTTHMTVADGLARSEFTSSDASPAASLARGSYMVISARDTTLLSVLPSQQMAMIMSSQMLGDGSIELPSFASHATSSSYTDLGPGEKVLGHETHRYRLTAAGSFDATINGKTCTRDLTGTTEMWVASDIDPWPMLEMQMRAYGPRMLAHVDSARKAGAVADAPKGFPLRSRRTAVFTDSAGHERTVVTTMEYTEFEHAQLDHALFEAPADYRVMDMRTMPGLTPERVAAVSRSRPNPLCPME